MQLVIGNKNYSSWSMRPWVLMRELGLPFEERKLRFDFADGSDFRLAVARVSPAGRVPVLLIEDDELDDKGASQGPGFAVWDTLAIVECLHERFPDRGIWPADPRHRARARSVAAEMHSGFSTLRELCPMNIEASLAQVGERLWDDHAGLRANLARIEALWADALQDSGGPFLFGDFSAADAFYAPVCMRLRTYGLPLSDTAAGYVARVAATFGVAQWIRDALAEDDFLDFEEPYRSAAPPA